MKSENLMEIRKREIKTRCELVAINETNGFPFECEEDSSFL